MDGKCIHELVAYKLKFKDKKYIVYYISHLNFSFLNLCPEVHVIWVTVFHKHILFFNCAFSINN